MTKALGKIYPNRWIYGTDITTKDQNISYLRHKAQAKYRKEEYNLTFAEYKSIWDQHLPFSDLSYWEYKGNISTSYNLTRKDKKLPWEMNNLIIKQRSEIIKGRPKGMKNKTKSPGK